MPNPIKTGDDSGTRRYGDGEAVTALASTSTQSSTINAAEVMLHAAVACFVKAGEDPTADTTTSIPLEAGEKFHMEIVAGDKIAVIASSTEGNLYIVPVIP